MKNNNKRRVLSSGSDIFHILSLDRDCFPLIYQETFYTQLKPYEVSDLTFWHKNTTGHLRHAWTMNCASMGFCHIEIHIVLWIRELISHSKTNDPASKWPNGWIWLLTCRVKWVQSSLKSIVSVFFSDLLLTVTKVRSIEMEEDDILMYRSVTNRFLLRSWIILLETHVYNADISATISIQDIYINSSCYKNPRGS